MKDEIIMGNFTTIDYKDIISILDLSICCYKKELLDNYEERHMSIKDMSKMEYTLFAIPYAKLSVAQDKLKDLEKLCSDYEILVEQCDYDTDELKDSMEELIEIAELVEDTILGIKLNLNNTLKSIKEKIDGFTGSIRKKAGVLK